MTKTMKLLTTLALIIITSSNGNNIIARHN